jgi:DnaJ-domain-containing protein 1
MKQLKSAKEANNILKEEINESQLRLKAAKYGHKLEEIVPPY